MRGALLTAAVVAGATVTALAVGPSGASASNYQFVGYAGGSLVRAANNTITSDLTAASAIGSAYETSSSNKAAGVTVRGLIDVGAVTTSSYSKAISGGYEVVSEARLAHVNLLSGAITANAVDTISTTRLVNGKISGGSSTTYVGLKIVGVKLPVTIPNNYHVTIPNVASLYLNYSLSSAAAPSGMNIGMGLYIGLLKAVGTNPKGAWVMMTPTYAALGPISIPKSGHIVRGNAYGTKVNAKAGTLVNVESDPTAPVSMQAAGTDGKTVTSNIAGVNLTPLAHVGAIVDTAKSTNTNSLWESETTSKVAGINLFNGAIRAEAVTADAHVRGTSSGTTVTGASQLVNLSIAGHSIPLNAKPNTVMHVLNLGTITINKQTRSGTGVTVCAVDIVLGKATGGFPAGAEIQLAVASASAN
jgi:hypothetical protein